MSSIALSYPLIGQRPSTTQEAKEAAKLARELGFGQQVELRVETVSNVLDGLQVMLADCGRCWN
jgi:hypothetical protein